MLVAKNAVHQSFASVIENLHKVADSDYPKTRAPAVVIAERKAVDILRRRRKLNTTSFDEADDGIKIVPPPNNLLADAMARLPLLNIAR